MAVIETRHISLVEAVFAHVSLYRGIDDAFPSVAFPITFVLCFLRDTRFKHIYPSILCDRNFKRRTLLHLATSNGYRDVVLELLNHGADIDLTDVDGATPLKLVISGGQVELIDILLQKGAELKGISREDWRGCLLHCGKKGGYLVLTEEGPIGEPPEAAIGPGWDCGGDGKRTRRYFQLVSDLKDVKTPPGDKRRLL